MLVLVIGTHSWVEFIPNEKLAMKQLAAEKLF